MPVVSLQKVDTGVIIATYEVGEHIIGRGPKLCCTSKKVSRSHGILKITENDGVFLRSTHNNPCFYTSNNLNICIIQFGQTILIHNEDKVALCLDHGWFKVLIKDSANNNNEPSTSSPTRNTTVDSGNGETTSIKRELEDETGEGTKKRVKVSEPHNSETSIDYQSQNNDTTIINESIVAVNQASDDLIPEADIKTEKSDEQVEVNSDQASCVNDNSEVKIKEEPIDYTVQTINNQADTPITNLEIKQENEVQKPDSGDSEQPNKADVKGENEIDGCDEKNVDSCKNNDKPSTSGTSNRVWRDKCWYAGACYRKNVAHRAALRHPGDSDYDSDPNDSRPICCYGTDCYRKNTEHRRRFQHPGQNKLGTKPASTRTRRKVKTKNQSPADSDLDDYDYSDPFLNDGESSDDYVPSGDSDTESDYEPEDNSQQEDRTRMIREARKFTRKK